MSMSGSLVSLISPTSSCTRKGSLLPFEMADVILDVSFGVALTSESNLPYSKFKSHIYHLWHLHLFVIFERKGVSPLLAYESLSAFNSLHCNIFCRSRASPLLWKLSSTSCNSGLHCSFWLIEKQSAYHFYVTMLLNFPWLNQDQVYPRHLCFFLVYHVHNYTIIFPARYIYCEVSVLRLKFANMFCWC